MSFRKLASVLPSLLLLCLALHAAPAWAQLGLTDVTCKGAVKQTWTPGLKVFPQNITYTNLTNYNVCTSTDPTIVSGVIDVNATYFNSCLANAETVETTVRWNDGTSSTLSILGIGANVVGNVQIFTSLGSVVAGRFEGDSVVLTNTFVTLDLLGCLASGGLTKLAGTSTLLIIAPLGRPTP